MKLLTKENEGLLPALYSQEEKGEEAVAMGGCRVEPDGTCSHGHESWLLRLGYI